MLHNGVLYLFGRIVLQNSLHRCSLCCCCQTHRFLHSHRDKLLRKNFNIFNIIYEIVCVDFKCFSGFSVLIAVTNLICIHNNYSFYSTMLSHSCMTVTLVNYVSDFNKFNVHMNI